MLYFSYLTINYVVIYMKNKNYLVTILALAAAFTLGGCTGFQRTLGGAAIGAGAGAAVSGASGGDVGTGALVGGAIGAGAGALSH